MIREHIVEEYMESQINFLMKMKEIDREEATTFVKSICKERYQPPKIKTIKMDRPGYETVKEISFQEFVKATKNNIVCPNGRIYVNPKFRPARIRQYIKDLLLRRKFHKNKMFTHQQKEEYEQAAMEKSNESRIKIDANTITGGAKNSPYSCFYDKAGFNAVTSVARLMIKTNYSILEQVFGGNYYFKDINELIHNIILRCRYCPDKVVLNKLVTKYNLYVPNRKDLLDRYQFFMNLYEVGPSYLEKETITNYKSIIPFTTFDILREKSNIFTSEEKIVNLKIINDLLNNLEDHEILFLFYVNNLRELFWKNSDTFKPILTRMSNNLENNLGNDFAISDIFKLDGTITPIVSTFFANIVKGEEVAEIVKKDEDLGKKFSNYTHFLFDHIKELDDLFNVFIRTNITMSRTSIKENMFRNTTLGSDTDSVIYTLKDWLKWYKGDYFNEDEDADTFLAIIGYFVSKTAEHNMLLFSEHLGSEDEDRYILKMKGEYDFNSMVFYLIKKHYTGVMTIQEGRVLPKIKLDIKGIGLRNSAIPKLVADKLKETTIETQQQQTASKYIKEVTQLEKEMAIDLKKGSTQFLKSISVKNKETYANSDSSAYLYLDMWNKTFGDKYGYLKTPVKCPLVFLLSINEDNLSYVKKIDIDIYNRLKEFKSRFPKRDLTNIVINPLLKKVPEELIALMDIRKQVFTNIRPMYLTLESFGIFMMHSQKKKLLLSDYYNELDLKLSESDEEIIEE